MARRNTYTFIIRSLGELQEGIRQHTGYMSLPPTDILQGMAILPHTVENQYEVVLTVKEACRHTPCDHTYSAGTDTGWHVCTKCGDTA